MNKKNIPEYLVNTIREYGTSQQEIGNAFGVSQSTISRRLNGDQKK